MLTRIAIFLSVLAAPAMAWACTSVPVEAKPIDYLLFGVVAGVFYRLFLQPRFDASEAIHSAVYLSLLVASYGLGAMVVQESSLHGGHFGVFGLVAASLGSLSPKFTMVRHFVLLPLLVSATILSTYLIVGENESRCNEPFDHYNSTQPVEF